MDDDACTSPCLDLCNQLVGRDECCPRATNEPRVEAEKACMRAVSAKRIRVTVEEQRRARERDVGIDQQRGEHRWVRYDHGPRPAGGEVGECPDGAHDVANGHESTPCDPKIVIAARLTPDRSGDLLRPTGHGAPCEEDDGS